MAYELVLASPGSPDPDFVAASPFGKIPALQGRRLHASPNSSAIVAYLEAKQPAPPLCRPSREARGQAVWFDEFADTVYAASGLKILFNRLVAPEHPQAAL